MSLWLIEARYKVIWDLRNTGVPHAAIGRKLGLTAARVRELIAESMDGEARDRLKFGEPDTPQSFYWHERFG